MGRHGLGEEREYRQPQTRIQLEGCFQLSWGKGGGCLLVCKNPSFQHLWAEVAFLSPLELLQAVIPFPLILRSKNQPPY